MGGGPLGQSQSFFFLVIVGEGLGDLWVRGRTSGERSGFFWSGLFTLIFMILERLLMYQMQETVSSALQQPFPKTPSY